MQPEPTSPATPPKRIQLSPSQLLLLAILMVVIGILIAGVALVIQRHAKPSTEATPKTASVHITSQGFQPASLKVKPGTEVVWVSDDADHIHVVASNPYPKDNGLKGLKSAQLGINAQYTYAFANAGTYTYHDDLDPTLNGVVTVQK